MLAQFVTTFVAHYRLPMWKGTIFEPCMAEEDPKEHTKIAFIPVYFAFPRKKKSNVDVEELFESISPKDHIPMPYMLP